MIERICAAFRMLEDDESREIYVGKLNYEVTGNMKFIYEIVDKYVPDLKNNFKWEHFRKQMVKISNERKIYIYGAGGEGDAMYRFIKTNGINIEAFVDRNAELIGEKVVPVILPSEFYKAYEKGDCAVVIGTEMFFDEIYNNLVKNGIKKHDIYGGAANWKKQYFDMSIMKWADKERMVDCGALNLNTSREFIKVCPSVDKIYAFEPDIINYKNCIRIKEKENLQFIDVIKKGVGEKSAIMKFNLTGNGTSHVSDFGNEIIEITSLDNELGNCEITFIKMDIEGLELEALKGSRDIIRRSKPKLAISVYHKPDDLVDIFHYIKEIVPEYKLYLRHYSIFPVETVLYATI